MRDAPRGSTEAVLQEREKPAPPERLFYVNAMVGDPRVELGTSAMSRRPNGSPSQYNTGNRRVIRTV